MSGETKEVIKTVWKKISVAVLKSFRGLLCEKKDGAWELSKGRTAFWVVFVHCMHVWNKGVQVAKAVSDSVTDAVETGTDVAASVGAGAVETATNVVQSLSANTGVPEQEFYLLMALLGYSAIKTTKGGMTNALAALRGNGGGQ